MDEDDKTGNSDLDETLSLGGNIELSGFRQIDRSSMVIVKKVVGNYARKFSEIASNFENISVVMKPVHQQQDNKKIELHAKLMNNGKPVVSETTDKNLFVALDKVLSKIQDQL